MNVICQQSGGTLHGSGNLLNLIKYHRRCVKPQSDLPGSGPETPRTKNPAWFGVVWVNPWQIRGLDPWSGVTLGWSLVVRDGPGSAPDVLKCLKHPGRSGAVREALQSGANPALSGCNRVLSVTHPGSPCVVRVSSVSRPGQSGTF